LETNSFILLSNTPLSKSTLLWHLRPMLSPCPHHFPFVTDAGSRFIGSRGNYTAALRVSADDYRLSLQFRGKRLLHRNEEGVRINMEDTASHETAC
jgi:hypothetical protein